MRKYLVFLLVYLLLIVSSFKYLSNTYLSLSIATLLLLRLNTDKRLLNFFSSSSSITPFTSFIEYNGLFALPRLAGGLFIAVLTQVYAAAHSLA